MMRFFLRLAGMIALSIAVIMSTGDVMRSVAASALVFTPLGESWAFGSPGTLASVQDYASADSPGDSLFGLLNLPGSVVFLVIAVLPMLLGRRRRTTTGRATI